MTVNTPAEMLIKGTELHHLNPRCKAIPAFKERCQSWQADRNWGAGADANEIQSGVQIWSCGHRCQGTKSLLLGSLK